MVFNLYFYLRFKMLTILINTVKFSNWLILNESVYVKLIINSDVKCDVVHMLPLLTKGFLFINNVFQ